MGGGGDIGRSAKYPSAHVEEISPYLIDSTGEKPDRLLALIYLVQPLPGQQHVMHARNRREGKCRI